MGPAQLLLYAYLSQLYHPPPDFPNAIQFKDNLWCLLSLIFSSDPTYGPFFLSKVYLINVYIQVWIRPYELPLLAFIGAPHPADTNTLIGFHLYLPIDFL